MVMRLLSMKNMDMVPRALSLSQCLSRTKMPMGTPTTETVELQKPLAHPVTSSDATESGRVHVALLPKSWTARKMQISRLMPICSQPTGRTMRVSVPRMQPGTQLIHSHFMSGQ